MSKIYDYEIETIDGENLSMEEYRGKVLLIVNVASQCGFTNQYKELEEIYKEFKNDDFVILGFPCNQFGGQEPGDAEEIKNFCRLNYNITFPMFKKIDVNGDNASPLFEYLKFEKPGLLGTKAVKWNFTKFLVDRSGEVLERIASKDSPKKAVDKIKKALAKLN